MTNEELLVALDRRFEHIDHRFEQIDHRFEQIDGRLEENRRHTDVLFETVRGDIQQLAEVIALVDEKLERFRAETNRRFEVLLA